MGSNATRNPFRRATLGLYDQQAVDAYKAASIWGAWWQLEESTRRRYFTGEERKFIRRYGARLDAISCMRELLSNDDERHFLIVCMGQAEPRSERERLWLYAQMVCRYERSLQRAARTDLVEYENAALRIENRALRADLSATEREYMEILAELKMHRGEEELTRPIGNITWATPRFVAAVHMMGSPAFRPIMTPASRGVPAQVLKPSLAGVGR